jgi:N-acetylneuraminate lyase
MNANRLTGLVAASFTAFHDDGSLNLDPIESHAALLVRNGVTGVFVCGSTGEGVSMTTDERIRCLQRWCDVVTGAGRPLKLIAHVGHNSLHDARALAMHAQKSGATRLRDLLHPACCAGGARRSGRLVAAVAAAAPELRYYYYHIPVLTGARHDMTRFIVRAAESDPDISPASIHRRESDGVRQPA